MEYLALVLSSRKHEGKVVCNLLVLLPDSVLYRTFWLETSQFPFDRTGDIKGSDVYPCISFKYERGEMGEKDIISGVEAESPRSIIDFVISNQTS